MQSNKPTHTSWSRVINMPWLGACWLRDWRVFAVLDTFLLQKLVAASPRKRKSMCMYFYVEVHEENFNRLTPIGMWYIMGFSLWSRHCVYCKQCKTMGSKYFTAGSKYIRVAFFSDKEGMCGTDRVLLVGKNRGLENVRLLCCLDLFLGFKWSCVVNAFSGEFGWMDNYNVLELIGEGSFGKVYKVYPAPSIRKPQERFYCSMRKHLHSRISIQ